MTLLYQCDAELILEMSYEALAVVQRLVEDFTANGMLHKPDVRSELIGFANAIRSELQHRPTPTQPDNSDLV
jgi:hypothetical protein